MARCTLASLPVLGRRVCMPDIWRRPLCVVSQHRPYSSAQDWDAQSGPGTWGRQSESGNSSGAPQQGRSQVNDSERSNENGVNDRRPPAPVYDKKPWLATPYNNGWGVRQGGQENAGDGGGYNGQSKWKRPGPGSWGGGGWSAGGYNNFRRTTPGTSNNWVTGVSPLSLSFFTGKACVVIQPNACAFEKKFGKLVATQEGGLTFSFMPKMQQGNRYDREARVQNFVRASHLGGLVEFADFACSLAFNNFLRSAPSGSPTSVSSPPVVTPHQTRDSSGQTSEAESSVVSLDEPSAQGSELLATLPVIELPSSGNCSMSLRLATTETNARHHSGLYTWPVAVLTCMPPKPTTASGTENHNQAQDKLEVTLRTSDLRILSKLLQESLPSMLGWSAFFTTSAARAASAPATQNATQNATQQPWRSNQDRQGGGGGSQGNFNGQGGSGASQFE
eukprot:GHVT01037117.1.p1 GENE.GHVT01037117.1~~GHVT01037117.1.p1  ORF type:complete len:448 (+),score=37.61 GHVT01037117.1:291-1634(+)